MKKLVVSIVLLIIVVLATGALGCSQIKGRGTFYDWYTSNETYLGDPVEFKVNLVAGKSSDIHNWTDVSGSIHLYDEVKGIKVRGGSKMRFFPYNTDVMCLMVWDVTVNGKHYDCLDVYYYENEGFWIFIYGGGPTYIWWADEDKIEGDIIIKD